MSKEQPDNLDTSPLERDAPEYTFENGVSEATKRILDLLKEKSPVVVAFTGSSTNVGKTTLSKALIERLDTEGAHPFSYKRTEDVGRLHGEDYYDQNLVFIFEQLEWFSFPIDKHNEMKQYWNKEVATAFRKIDRETQGIDLWIAIYSPDQPFRTHTQSGEILRPIGDIIIRNEAARKK